MMKLLKKLFGKTNWVYTFYYPPDCPKIVYKVRYSLESPEFEYLIDSKHTHVPGVENPDIVPYWSKFCPWSDTDDEDTDLLVW